MWENYNREKRNESAPTVVEYGKTAKGLPRAA